MSAKAAKLAVENAGIDPKEIDLILDITEEWKEYPLTTSALYVQDQIGAVNAWGIDVQNRCCTAISAMTIAKNMMLADDDINTVLISGGYRNVDYVDYTDKPMSMMYNLGAGGGAIILQKGYDKNVLLGSHIMSDGSLSRTAGVKIGGQVNPITGDNWKEAKTSLRLMDAQKMKDRLNEVSMPNWINCIDESLRKSGYTREDFSRNGYLGILHIKRSGHEWMLEQLGLTDKQSIYLEDYGHIGQIDQFLSLDLAMKQGLLKKGTIAVLLAAGIGYVWAANVVRWG
jgi:3-oxoacyl-[acyl-carrier-protein] synthase-3